MDTDEPERLALTVRWFVWFGTRKLDRWVRQTSPPSHELGNEAGALYKALARTTSWPRNPVLRWHLAGYLLPGVALYRGLQTEGRSTGSAAEVVGTLLEDDTQGRRRRLERLGRRPGFFVTFAVMVRPLTRLTYPPSGWRAEWLEVSRNRIAFDMTGCFYLDTLTQLGAPELTPVLCRVDDLLYEGVSPELTWRRTTMLSTGGERCDFRFERCRPPDVTLP
jgi:hypothetical protein